MSGLEAGADPHLVAGWMAEVQARRAEAISRSHAVTHQQRMTADEIREMVPALEDVRAALADADPAEKFEVYQQIGLV